MHWREDMWYVGGLDGEGHPERGNSLGSSTEIHGLIR